MRLARKVAMVTGAAQGIGAAIAGEFAKAGAVVYALDRSPRLEATCTQICEAGGKAFSSRLDITDHQAYSDLVSNIVQTQGRIDILVNNAAIAYYEELLILLCYKHPSGCLCGAGFSVCPKGADYQWGKDPLE